MSMVYESGFVAETDPLSEDRQLIELLDNGNVEAFSQRLAEITRRERQQAVREILKDGASALDKMSKGNSDLTQREQLGLEAIVRLTGR